ncbi:MAG TPA: DUF1054 family protein [Candidatus Binataceae bacterium]|nr:DUF1054 family protein [Candidatus Binataceae bacterium]
MPTLGFYRADFQVFLVEGFNERMAQLYATVRPKLMRLGDELAPSLARKLHLEFFPHVAKHARRTVNPPPETWCAFGPSARGYKRYPYLGLCISGFGLHARVVVKSEADNRPQMSEILQRKAADLTRALDGTLVARYDNWSFDALPAAVRADEEFWQQLAGSLAKKTGGIDIGVGWPIREALRVDREEVLEGFRELEPLYRACRTVA